MTSARSYRALPTTWFGALAAGFVTMLLIAFAPTPAAAQDWQEYRRDDFGFRIEMPGKPTIETEESSEADMPVKSTSAELDVDDVLYSVVHDQYGKGALASRPIDPWLDESRDLIQKILGVKVTREERLTMNGFPAREIVFETDGFHAVIRIVVLGDRTVKVGAIGHEPLKGKPAVERFLRSFTLLQSK